METATQLKREGDYSLHAPSAPIEYSPAVPPERTTPKSPDLEEYDSSSEPTEADRGWIFRPLIWVVVTLLGLYLIAQFVSVVRNTLTLSTTIRWPLLILEAIALLFLASLAIRGLLLFRSFPSFDSISTKDRVDEPEKSKERLIELLKKIGDPDAWSKRCQFQDQSDMTVRLRRLTTQEFADEDAWWDAYDTFEKKREDRAQEIKRHYALQIAVNTSISPWKIVDLAAVLYNSTRMVQDIVILYNRRGLSRGRAFSLVCHFTLNICVSGELGEIGGDALKELVKDCLADVLPEMGAGLVGNLAGKVGEGLVNYIFARKLGQRTIRYFRPIESLKAH